MTPMLLCILPAFLTLALTANPALAGEDAANATLVEGTAVQDSGNGWKELAQGAAVANGNKVKTETGARLELSVGPSDFVRLNENTAAQVNIATDPARKIQIILEQGDLWTDMDRLGKGEEFEVLTPLAGASIRGTSFNTHVEKDGSTTVSVISGKVEVYNPRHKEKPKFDTKSERKEVAPPGEVAAPSEVTEEQWMEIVEAGQSMTISSSGGRYVLPVGEGADDSAKKWQEFNKNRKSEAKGKGK